MERPLISKNKPPSSFTTVYQSVIYIPYNSLIVVFIFLFFSHLVISFPLKVGPAGLHQQATPRYS